MKQCSIYLFGFATNDALRSGNLPQIEGPGWDFSTPEGLALYRGVQCVGNSAAVHTSKRPVQGSFVTRTGVYSFVRFISKKSTFTQNGTYEQHGFRYNASGLHNAVSSSALDTMLTLNGNSITSNTTYRLTGQLVIATQPQQCFTGIVTMIFDVRSYIGAPGEPSPAFNLTDPTCMMLSNQNTQDRKSFGAV